MRALVSREFTVRLYVEDEDGNLVAADATPTVEVRDGDGELVAGVSAVTSESVGVYKATVPPVGVLDVYTARWTYTVGGFARDTESRVDVVGARLVDLHTLRGESYLSALDGPTLRYVLEVVEDWTRDALHFPPFPQSLRVTWTEPFGTPGLCPPGVYVPVELLALSRDGTAYTASELAEVDVEDGDYVRRRNGAVLDWPAGVYTAHLVHGWPSVPVDLQRAARVFARYLARENQLPERAVQVTTQEALISLATPTPDRPTGLPEVDAAVTRYQIKELF